MTARTYYIEETGNPRSMPFVVKDDLGRIRRGAWSSEEAEEDIERLKWLDSLPVGQRTSALLVDVRSVASMAQTPVEESEIDSTQYDDEDREILEDLRKVVELLDRWKRTGRPPKYTDERETDG